MDDWDDQPPEGHWRLTGDGPAVYVPDTIDAILDELERSCRQMNALDQRITALMAAAMDQASLRDIALRTDGRFTHGTVRNRVRNRTTNTRGEENQ